MKLTGDLDKDLREIKQNLDDRGIEDVTAHIRIETDNGITVKRSFMSIVTPMLLSAVHLGMQGEITEEELKSKKCHEMMSALSSVALVKELIEYIEAKELSKLIKHLGEYNGKKSN